MTTDELTERLDALEAQLDEQQATIERQQERIDEQEAVIADQRERLDQETTPAAESEPAEPETADENSEGPGPIATRRGVLTAGSVLGLLGVGAGTASADASGQIGTSSDPLNNLYTAQLNGSGSGLTVTTNDNGNLTLDPGANNELSLSNQSTSSSGSLLARDGSGNVVEASGTTLSDVGGGSAAWGDGSDNTNLLEPSDGSKTGIEDVTQIRSNDSLTVDIDADNSGSGSTFTVKTDKDSGSATSLLTVNDGGDVDVHNGNLDVQGGTVENTNGTLSLSTGSGDLSLQPSGDIDLGTQNKITGAYEIYSDENNITFKGSADVNLDGSILADKGGDMDIISTNSVNVDIDNDDNDTDGTREFNVTKDGGTTTLFTVNDGGDIDVHNGNLDVQGGTVENSTGDLTLAGGDLILNPSTASKYTIEGAQTGSMTKDPSSNTPDGYIQIDVNGTTREIPFYDVGPS